MIPNIRIVCAWALIVLGAILLPIPIVPGAPLIVAGAALLGPNHPLVQASKTWLQRRGFLKKESDGSTESLAEERRPK
jgi:hypothetical protein